MTKKSTLKVDTKDVAKKTVVKEATKKSETLVKEVTKKPEVKQATVKAAVKPTKVMTAKPEAKKVATKVEVKAVKDEVVKPSAKKAIKAEKPTAKTVKIETKVAAKPTVKKTAVKVTAKPIEKATKLEAKKTTKKVVKPAGKKTDVKATAKPVAKKATAVKKPAKKQSDKYVEVSLDACLAAMLALGVEYEYADYCRLLLDEVELSVLEKNIIEGNKLAERKYDFDIDGYDLDVVIATLTKVADTMDITAADFKAIKKAMDACVKTKLVVDADENAKNYLEELKVAEKVLMVGQRKNITTAKEATALLKSDVVKFFDHLKKTAYTVLKNWKYEDVEFYQEFAFAFVSQYIDMFDDYQNEIQMDCADLYILHGDEGRGDHEYNYILRENEIKDYIFYRFANVYVERNLDKAKSIAESSFQWVDERYDYYKNIVEIIKK